MRFDNLEYELKTISTHTHESPPNWFRKMSIFFGLKTTSNHYDFKTIKAGESYELNCNDGPGRIKNIWMTALPLINEKIITPSNIPRMLFKNILYNTTIKKSSISFYFDNKKTGELPLGDFFGLGFGIKKNFENKYFNVNNLGMNCNIEMPFNESFKIIVKNNDNKLMIPAFYAVIEYEKCNELKNDYYFNIQYNQDFEKIKGEPFQLLKVENEGVYIGSNLNVVGEKRLRFLEGNVKANVDGKQDFEYTGTEDFFLSAFYFGKEFNHKNNGLILKKGKKMSLYRFLQMPFKKEIEILMHRGEYDEIPTKNSCTSYYFTKKL